VAIVSIIIIRKIIIRQIMEIFIEVMEIFDIQVSSSMVLVKLTSILIITRIPIIKNKNMKKIQYRRCKK
jgi:hypothetical protein